MPMTEMRQRWLITLLLVALGGALGLHRFYVGKIKTGILMLLTAGGCGIWALIDLIIVVMGRFETSEGERITYG